MNANRDPKKQQAFTLEQIAPWLRGFLGGGNPDEEMQATVDVMNEMALASVRAGNS